MALLTMLMTEVTLPFCPKFCSIAIYTWSIIRSIRISTTNKKFARFSVAASTEFEQLIHLVVLFK